MKTLTSKLAVITVAFLMSFAFACGGDDKEAETPNDTTATEDGTGDVAVTPDDVTETPDDVAETPDDVAETPDDVAETPDDAVEGDVAVPAGACMNADDGALLQADQDGITEDATTCGLGCMADEDKPGCSTTCVAEATGLSEGCTACYVGMILCSIDNCLQICAPDTSSEACAACQEEFACYTDFYACSGLTPAAE